MDILDLAPILAVPAIQKVIDLYRQFVLERDARKVAFTVGAWLVGAGLVLIVSQSTLGPDLPPLNWADVALLGIGLGSTASVLHDATKRETTIVAVDAADLGVGVVTDPDVVEPAPLT